MKLAILGATGRTGRHLVTQALAAGHDVRALCRRVGALPADGRLTVIEAQLRDEAGFQKTVDGCDAVLSALGPVGEDVTVCSAAAALAIKHGVNRYVSISGAGVDAPGDAKGFGARLVSWVVRTVQPAVFADKVRELELLTNSSLVWTLVRPPRLVDSSKRRPVRATLNQAASASIGREDLAQFCLAQANSTEFVHRAPFVAWE